MLGKCKRNKRYSQLLALRYICYRDELRVNAATYRDELRTYHDDDDDVLGRTWNEASNAVTDRRKLKKLEMRESILKHVLKNEARPRLVVMTG